MANYSALVKIGPRPLVVPITIVFFLCLLAGQFSFERAGLPNFLVIPERLAGMLLVGFAAVVLAAANARSLNGSRVRSALPLALPTAWALLTALWAPVTAPDLAVVVVDLACMIIAVGVTATLLRLDPVYFPLTMLWLLAAAGMLYSVVGLLTATVGARTAVFGGGPNVYGRVTMLGFVALIALVLLKQAPAIAAAASPLMLVAMISSGSRGAMLAAVVAATLIIPTVRVLSTTHKLLMLTSIAVCGGLVYSRYSDVVVSTVSGRVIDLTLQQGYTSGRDELTGAALELYRQHPILGGGLRSFAEFFGQGFTYPHNALLHTLSEGGIVGLAILVGVLLVTVGRSIRPARVGSVGYFFGVCAVIILVSSMFSGDYYDQRFLWVFLLIALNASPRPNLKAHDGSVLRTGTAGTAAPGGRRPFRRGR